MSECSIKPYDSIYLGMPYCWEYEGNLISNTDDLVSAIEILHTQRKKAYVTTFAVPRNRDLERVFKTINAVVEMCDGIEASNLGIIRYLTKEYPDVMVIAGGMANVYTASTAELLYSIGVSRIIPSYELSIEDIEKIKDTGVEVEVVVHGKFLSV